MSYFVVVLHSKDKDVKPEYFTPQNEIVPAMRARLQDPTARRVTVREVSS